jgi:hypothetical protein
MTTDGGQETPHKGILNKMGDFFKGIGKGITNFVKNLFSPVGLLMAGSAIALAVLAPWTIPLMAGAGLLLGGFQFLKGAVTDDWEKAGEGAFAMGASFAGMRFGPKSLTASGEEFALSSKGAQSQGWWSETKTTITNTFRMIKGEKLNPTNPNSTATPMTLYRLGTNDVTSRWNTFRNKSAPSGEGAGDNAAVTGNANANVMSEYITGPLKKGVGYVQDNKGAFLSSAGISTGLGLTENA